MQAYVLLWLQSLTVCNLDVPTLLRTSIYVNSFFHIAFQCARILGDIGLKARKTTIK